MIKITLAEWTNLAIAVCTAVAAVAAAYSANLSREQSQNALGAAAVETVRVDLSEYLTSYESMMHSKSDQALATAFAFQHASAEKQQQAIIVAARLLALAEAMNIAKDARADEWAGYLKQCQGPLSRKQQMEIYASTAFGRRALANAHAAGLNGPR